MTHEQHSCAGKGEKHSKTYSYLDDRRSIHTTTAGDEDLSSTAFGPSQDVSDFFRPRRVNLQNEGRDQWPDGQLHQQYTTNLVLLIDITSVSTIENGIWISLARLPIMSPFASAHGVLVSGSSAGRARSLTSSCQRIIEPWKVITRAWNAWFLHTHRLDEVTQNPLAKERLAILTTHIQNKPYRVRTSRQGTFQGVALQRNGTPRAVF